jgi:hypothetical protein
MKKKEEKTGQLQLVSIKLDTHQKIKVMAALEGIAIKEMVEIIINEAYEKININ